jgi:hypothetical protein
LVSETPEIRGNKRERCVTKSLKTLAFWSATSRLHREGREFESLAAYHSTQRQPQRVIRDISCAAISLAQCHLPLLQKPQKSLAGPAIQFLGIQRPVIVPVGGFETLRDDGKVFFLRQRSVMIGVGGGEFRR